MASPEEQVEEVIRRGQSWYGQKYRKSFVVLRRYDKEDKHWTWQITCDIAGRERRMQFGMTEAMTKQNKWNTYLERLFDHIKYTITKAQSKWEPELLARK